MVLLLSFSAELDVEDFDAFLEKVKARSLGNSPFSCKLYSCYLLVKWALTLDA